MSSPIKVRVMTGADLPFADSVRSLAGWNQTPQDWRRFLATEPHGCFVAEWDGVLAGTATTIAYGTDLAWIGMMLVHPNFRRRGIGGALIGRCIEFLRGKNVRCIRLDGTPLGKAVYDTLGFRTESHLARWERVAGSACDAKDDAGIAAWRDADAGGIDTLDTAAFGTPRARLLHALASDSRVAIISQPEARGVSGFGMLRPGAHAAYLGPCSATDERTGLRLIGQLVSQAGGARIFWDIPEENEAAVAWAQQNGFTKQRPLIRMALGENAPRGDCRKQFAIAGPEVG